MWRLRMNTANRIGEDGMCNFRVGQKVTMVQGYEPKVYDRAKSEGVTLPETGVVYTVRGIEDGLGWYSGVPFIWLEELRNAPHVSDGVEPNWDARLFRPVVDRKTDISIFTAMLNAEHTKERA